MPTPVTPAFVLEGALLALEQCGLLLRDAVHLYNRSSYATAVVLAAYAQEELGRERLLLDLWRRSCSGIEVTIEQIEDVYADHERKQAAGMLSTGLMAEGSSTSLGKLLHRRIHGPPYDAEWRDADSQLNELVARKQSRTPHDRHQQRMTALYVELTSAKNGWSRPADMPLRTAYSRVNEAVNDYVGERDRRVVTRVGEPADLDLFDAFALLDARARLPGPGQPEIPDPSRKP